jgi:hypothetical protein
MVDLENGRQIFCAMHVLRLLPEGIRQLRIQEESCPILYHVGVKFGVLLARYLDADPTS